MKKKNEVFECRHCGFQSEDLLDLIKHQTEKHADFIADFVKQAMSKVKIEFEKEDR